MTSEYDFNKAVFLKFGPYKYKPISAYSFRQLHRTIVEFYDYDLQQRCCDLAGVESVGYGLSFAYCCVDEHDGLQFHFLGAYNRDGKGKSDWWVPVPEGKEFVLSYSEANEKLASLSNASLEAMKLCFERCEPIMKKHEKNPTIMCKDFDKFRNIEYPLDVQISIPINDEESEKVWFRPVRKKLRNMYEGVLLGDPQKNTTLHKGDLLTVKFVYADKWRVIDVIQYIPPHWVAVDRGKTIGEIGSESGIIIRDEELSGQARITLEDCKTHFAITCGIYGGMVHTVFCEKEDSHTMYNDMKDDIFYFFENYDEYNFEEIDEFFEDFADNY
ncbi:MAG: hypothetical protein IJF40_06355 [Clostridia bacterium]|nr:hypothetical protein [Clostridia bacterium]